MLVVWTAGGPSYSYNSVYSSVDGGTTWSLFLGDNSGVYAFWIDENNQFKTAIYRSGASPQVPIFTTNSGASWTPAPSLSPLVGSRLIITSSGTLVCAGVVGSVLQTAYSTNGGNTWSTPVTLPGMTGQVAFSGGPLSDVYGNYYLLGADVSGTITIWVSTDGKLWNILKQWSGLVNSLGSPVDSNPSLTYKRVASTDVMFLSYDFPGIEQTIGNYVPQKGGGLVLLVSYDLGKTWSTSFSLPTVTNFVTPAPFLHAHYPHYYPYPGLCADGSWIMYLTQYYDAFGDSQFTVYRSRDNGASWAQESSAIPVTATSAPYLADPLIIGAGFGVTWGLSSGSATNITPKAYQSSDNGKTWILQTAPPFNGTIGATAVWSGPYTTNTLYTPVKGIPIDVAAPRANESNAPYKPVIRIFS